jgi:hypothetical protein
MRHAFSRITKELGKVMGEKKKMKSTQLKRDSDPMLLLSASFQFRSIKVTWCQSRIRRRHGRAFSAASRPLPSEALRRRIRLHRLETVTAVQVRCRAYPSPVMTASTPSCRAVVEGYVLLVRKDGDGAKGPIIINEQQLGLGTRRGSL